MSATYIVFYVNSYMVTIVVPNNFYNFILVLETEKCECRLEI